MSLCLTPGNKPIEPISLSLSLRLKCTHMYWSTHTHTYTHLLLCTDKATVIFPYSPSSSPALPLSPQNVNLNALSASSPALQYGVHKKKKKKACQDTHSLGNKENVQYRLTAGLFNGFGMKAPGIINHQQDRRYEFIEHVTEGSSRSFSGMRRDVSSAFP